jgi:hypothetical protein
LIILDDIGLNTLKRQVGLAEAFQSDSHFPLYSETQNIRLQIARQTAFIAPFIIEMSALNLGDEDSAWGLWVQTVDNQEWIFLINNSERFSAVDSREPSWMEFTHIHSVEENTIYLHFDNDYSDSPYPWNDERTLEIPSTITFRINNEIAWTGNLPPRVSAWGTAQYRNPELQWNSINLFTTWADTNTIRITPRE